MIVSINRGQNIEEAWENLELAKSSEICVGLDFSGNPEIRKFNDFEDNIQIHAAQKNSCDYIITRNIKDYKHSAIPVLTAEQFLETL